MALGRTAFRAYYSCSSELSPASPELLSALGLNGGKARAAVPHFISTHLEIFGQKDFFVFDFQEPQPKSYDFQLVLSHLITSGAEAAAATETKGMVVPR